ncbi:MAG: hypothetical protein WCJ19_01680 [bacterium]
MLADKSTMKELNKLMQRLSVYEVFNHTQPYNQITRSLLAFRYLSSIEFEKVYNYGQQIIGPDFSFTRSVACDQVDMKISLGKDMFLYYRLSSDFNGDNSFIAYRNCKTGWGYVFDENEKITVFDDSNKNYLNDKEKFQMVSLSIFASISLLNKILKRK